MKLLKSLFSSKKFIVALIGMTAIILSESGVVIPEGLTNHILAIFSVYIAAQGASDLGKEKAKLEKE